MLEPAPGSVGVNIFKLRGWVWGDVGVWHSLWPWGILLELVLTRGVWGIDCVAIHCGVIVSSTWKGVRILIRAFTHLSLEEVLSGSTSSTPCHFMVVGFRIICVCGMTVRSLHHRNFLGDCEERLLAPVLAGWLCGALTVLNVDPGKAVSCITWRKWMIVWRKST